MKVSRSVILATIGGLFLLTSLMLWSAGCSSKLDGTSLANQRPVVWFVNVPPEGSQSSVNPIVYWAGQDRDGVIDFYRFIVVRESIVGQVLGKPGEWNPTHEPLTETEVQTFVQTSLMNYDDTLWTYLYVDDDAGDPKTGNVIPMEAEIENPVIVYVPQFVFVQAYDEAGLGSDVQFRRFFRNDNPPQTEIIGKGNFTDSTVFINSLIPSGSSTGIRLRWSGSDVLDHPSDAPPFEFQWKLFGPYTDAELASVLDSFIVPVFVTNDAQVFRFGQPPDFIIDSIICDTLTHLCDTFGYLMPKAYIVCDTTYESGSEVIECDTILIDTITESNIYGVIDTIFRAVDTDFLNSPEYYRVADSSDDGTGFTWVNDTRDSLYNVFRNTPSDTTILMNFLFWVRSRDDAQVPDPTPDYVSFKMLDPKHERDIFILDMPPRRGSNRAIVDSVRNYYDRAIPRWMDSRADGDEMVWDTAVDFVRLTDVLNGSVIDAKGFLRRMLGHKVVILSNANATATPTWSDQTGAVVNYIYTALQSGVNIWYSGRQPLKVHSAGADPDTTVPNATYQYFWGVQQVCYSGWGKWANSPTNPTYRVEDFVTAVSINDARWPDLHIDRNNHKNRLTWKPAAQAWCTYDSNYIALPEVCWQVRSYDTEVQYLYGSMYGDQEHKYGSQFTMQGRPVAHRLNRGLFRTAHWLFSPIAFNDDEFQPALDDMLDWLYDGRYDFNESVVGKSRNGAVPAHGVTAKQMNDYFWDSFYSSNSPEEFRQKLNNVPF